MSSLATASVARIDHRTVFKNLQSETNKNSNDSTTAGNFNPLNKKTTASYFNKTKFHTHSTHIRTLPPLFIISPRTYVQQRSEISNLAPKTKIPYPLATLWSRQKPNYFKRSSSVRLRGTKSNLPLIMEPTINETPTNRPTTVNAEKSNETIVIESVAADGLQDTPKRKLVLISQTDANVAVSTPIKRSLSLRRNNNKNNIDNKTDISKNKLCGAKNLSSALLHDVIASNDQCDDIGTTTTSTAAPSIISTAPKVDKQTSAVTETVKDFRNMVRVSFLNFLYFYFNYIFTMSNVHTYVHV